ncbi:4Fe-4S binding protein [Thermoplasma sp.]|uniref:4Fe-4S binding protein n=1 Tax=Thermoplasma sp. TaxID=1973142 RepID=UPI001282A822|nr:4Fe-4S binding protein [Thermoplasma sp.]KAA8923517.1 MAG: 4Fe-4S dicluster domain-containing protein [Thermoplasma sp.]
MVLVPVSTVSTRNHPTDSWRIQRPTIQYDKCIRCMICWKYCPDNAINIENGDERAPNDRVAKMEYPVIDYNFCKGCGICANECPEKCIDMEFEVIE